MDKSEWIIYKVGSNQHILTETNEASIKAVMFDLYEPFCVVQVLDYTTGRLIEELKLEDLY